MKNRKWIKWAAIAAAAVLLMAGAAWVSLRDDQHPAPMVMYANTTSASSADRKMTASDAVMEMADYGIAPSAAMSAGSGTAFAETERKIVRTADLTLRTAAFDEAVEKVNAQVAEAGGYVENLYQYGDGNRRLNLSLRVPSEKLDAFLSGVEGVGRVTDRSESTTDMTVQYADNQARLDTLYQKRERLNVLLSQAESVSDLIEIESAIADTQYQIDSYESRQRTIDRQADMSLVNLTLIEDRPADSAQADISLWQRMQAGFAASIEWLGEFAQDLAVFVVMILPVAVPLAAVAAVIVVIRKRRKKA